MRRIVVVAGALALPAVLLVAPAAPTTAAACTISGTDGDDVLTGTPGPDVICGAGGRDVLRGGAGDDVLYGGDGPDVIVGNGDADQLFGGPGADRLLPGRDSDVVTGGSETDVVSYQDVSGGVTIDLAAGTAEGPEAGVDSLASTEGMTGTGADDVLSGDEGANSFAGLGGNDDIYPYGGQAKVLGGPGTDKLDLSAVDKGVTIYDNILRVDGFGRILSVEVIVGTRHDDDISTTGADERLFGLEGDDDLQAGGGNDLVRAGPGADFVLQGGGNDDLDGGSGLDELAYWRFMSVGVTVDLDAGEADKPDGSADHLSSFEALVGTFATDHLSGGLGATNVTINGILGDDHLSTVDGFGGDSVENSEPSFAGTCAGDPGDTVSCG